MQLTVYRRDNRKRSRRSWRQWIMVGSTFATLIVVSLALYGWRKQLMVAGAAARQFVLESPISLSGKFKCVEEKNSAVTKLSPWRVETWHEYLAH